ncbi:MAG: chemotaxis protein CheW [Cyclobacteriaceae bacterium]
MSAVADTTTNSFLTFRLHEEVFAANVSKVLEILELTKITKVPKAPEYMRGVINLRGSVLPVVDTRIKFGLPLKPETVNTCIVVLNIQIESEELKVGALVDAVQEVLEFTPESISPPPSIGSKYRSEFILGMGKVSDDFIMILDVDKVFSLDEILNIKLKAEDKPKEKEKAKA